MSLSNIDSNILSLIFDHLDLQSLSSVARTCDLFNKIAIGNDFILCPLF